MEKTVKKLLAATGLVISGAIALLPLTSYAEAITDTSDPHGVYNCAEGTSVPCASADMQVDSTTGEAGPTVVTVNVAPTLAIDAVALTCSGNQDSCVDVDADSKAILAIPNMVRTGTLSARIRSAKPFTISISAEDPYLKGYYDNGELSGYVIPASNSVAVGYNGWGIKKKVALDTDADTFTGVTTRPEVFYTSNDPQDDFGDFNFKVGVSVKENVPQGMYSTEIEITAATIGTN